MTWPLYRTKEPMSREDPDPRAWLDDLYGADADAESAAHGVADEALSQTERWIKAAYGDDCAMRRTPAGTAMGILEHCLPYGARYEPIPAGMAEVLHTWSFPHRWHAPHPTLPASAVTYDARLAFLATVRNVPVWLPTPDARDWWDEGTAYVPYRQAWYLCDVTVARGWQHIGLVPARPAEGAKFWLYPTQPGAEFQSWLHGSEVDLLREHQWPHAIRRRILFDAGESGDGKRGRDPLRQFYAPLVGHLEAMESWSSYSKPVVKAHRACVRALGLALIGRLHSRGGKMEWTADTSGALTLKPTGVPLNSYTERFHHPEWTAAIWAKSRVRTTNQALKVPYEDLLAIHGDAIVCRREQEGDGWQDTGRVGSYRRKGDVA